MPSGSYREKKIPFQYRKTNSYTSVVQSGEIFIYTLSIIKRNIVLLRIALFSAYLLSKWGNFPFLMWANASRLSLSARCVTASKSMDLFIY
jgi:hypothetical protein